MKGMFSMQSQKMSSIKVNAKIGKNQFEKKVLAAGFIQTITMKLSSGGLLFVLYFQKQAMYCAGIRLAAVIYEIVFTNSFHEKRKSVKIGRVLIKMG